MRNSGYERAEDDWYVEPAWAVQSLLRVESIPGPAYDPACGGGNIPRQLQAAGIVATGSDIAARGYGTVCDFFDVRAAIGAASIVSNPPYGQLEAFIRHAWELATAKVIVLARLAFLEGQGREALFSEIPLARVWVSRRRMSMPPGADFTIKAKGGTVAYAWFVFERGREPGPWHGGWC